MLIILDVVRLSVAYCCCVWDKCQLLLTGLGLIALIVVAFWLNAYYC